MERVSGPTSTSRGSVIPIAAAPSALLGRQVHFRIARQIDVVQGPWLEAAAVLAHGPGAAEAPGVQSAREIRVVGGRQRRTTSRRRRGRGSGEQRYPKKQVLDLLAVIERAAASDTCGERPLLFWRLHAELALVQSFRPIGTSAASRRSRHAPAFSGTPGPKVGHCV